MNKWLIGTLKASLIFVSIMILALSVFWLPYVARISAEVNPEFADLKYPILVGMYCTCIPFYIGVFHTYRLLRLINMEIAFTEEACKSLKAIILSAIGVIALYIIGTIYLSVENALHPGLLLLGFIIMLASFIIAVFTGVLKAVLMKVIEIKNDNELTI